MAEVKDAATEGKKPSGKAAKKILQEARERFAYVNTVDKDNKTAAADDIRFVYVPGASWSKEDQDKRKGRPCLSFPQFKQFINQTVNDQRQNRPGIRIHPAGGKASKETADIIQGLIRGIEYDSSAEAVYDTGFQYAVASGRGYWRIATDYEASHSFNQTLKIQRIADPSTVDLDPDFQEPDGSDRNWGFVSERVKEDDFKDRWPDASPINWDQFGNKDASYSNWYSDKEVVVADYYRRVCKDATLLLLSNRATVYFEDNEDLPDGVTVINQRKTKRYSVEWYKIAGGDQILEKYEWLGSIIPIVCCMGDEIIVDGKRVYQGLTRLAKDAQRMYDFKKSAEVERYALAPKAPWIAAAEAIDGYEVWKTANRENWDVLPYHAFTADGTTPLPIPQRVNPAPFEAAWANSAEIDKADIKAVIGMYENSLGLRAGETSGRAILAREKQGDNATFHFADNHSRAIALTGRILLELIPHYFDTNRMVTSVGIDDVRSQVEINKIDPITQAITENNVTEGEYAVAVEAGPSYATRQEEMSDTMLQLVQHFPPLMQVAADQVVGSMQFPDSDDLAERAKFLLLPAVQQMLAQKEGGQDPEAVAQQMQGQMQQMGQALQGMQQQLQQVMEENKTLQAGNQAKIETAHIDAATELEKARIDAAVKLQVADIMSQAKSDLTIQTEGMRQQAAGERHGAEMQQAGAQNSKQLEQAQTMAKMVALMESFGNLAQTIAAPRVTELQLDEQGNPIGSISRHQTATQ